MEHPRDSNPITDSEIIKKVLSGEKDAYAGLVRRHHARVLILCRQMLLVPSQADDAAQDVFVNVYGRLSSFRGDSEFSTWIYRVTANYCLDLLRKRKRERAESFEALLEGNRSILSKLTMSNPGPEAQSERNDLIRKVLGTLNEPERLVLSLREGQGLSYREISAVLDCSVDAAKARLKRARKALQEKARHIFQLENV